MFLIMIIQHMQRWIILFVENQKINDTLNKYLCFIYFCCKTNLSESKMNLILISSQYLVFWASFWKVSCIGNKYRSDFYFFFRFERFNQLRKYLFYELYCAIIDTYPGATWFFPCWQAQLSNDLSRSTTMSCLWNGKTFPGGIFLEWSRAQYKNKIFITNILWIMKKSSITVKQNICNIKFICWKWEFIWETFNRFLFPLKKSTLLCCRNERYKCILILFFL